MRLKVEKNFAFPPGYLSGDVSIDVLPNNHIDKECTLFNPVKIWSQLA